jgi:hypothetical protein
MCCALHGLHPLFILRLYRNIAMHDQMESKPCKQIRGRPMQPMEPWTLEDQGLLNAYNCREYLRAYGSFQHLSVTSPLPLGAGYRPLYLDAREQCHAIAESRFSREQFYSHRPDDWKYPRITYSFAKDPLTAPLIWIILAPFNFLSWLISRSVQTKTLSNRETDHGFVIVTDRALRQTVYGDVLRIPWSQVFAVDVNYSPPGINIRWRNGHGLLETSPVDKLALLLMMRNLALRNPGDDLVVPDSFIDRARRLGKL